PPPVCTLSLHDALPIFRLREKQVAPRISDLVSLVQSTGGKIELETVGDRDEEKVIDKLMQKAVLNVFNRHFALYEFDELLANFRSEEHTSELQSRENLV